MAMHSFIDSDDDEVDAAVVRIIRDNARLRAPPRDALTLAQLYPRAAAPLVSPLPSMVDEISREISAWIAAELIRGSSAPSPAAARNRDNDAGSSSAPLPATARDRDSRIESMRNLHDHPCPICLSPFTRTSLSILLPCWHRHCYSCITNWLRVSSATTSGCGRCPVCNAQPGALVYSIRSSTDYKSRNLTWEGTPCALAVRSTCSEDTS